MEIGSRTSFLNSLWSYPAVRVCLKNYRIPKKVASALDENKNVTENVNKNEVKSRRTDKSRGENTRSRTRIKSKAGETNKKNVKKAHEKAEKQASMKARKISDEEVVPKKRKCVHGNDKIPLGLDAEDPNVATSSPVEESAALVADGENEDESTMPNIVQAVPSVEEAARVDTSRNVTPQLQENTIETPDSAPVVSPAAVRQILMRLKRATDALAHNSRQREEASTMKINLQNEQQKLRDEIITKSREAANSDRQAISMRIKELEASLDDYKGQCAMHNAELYYYAESGMEQLDFDTYENMITAATEKIDHDEQAIKHLESQLGEWRVKLEEVNANELTLEEARTKIIDVERRLTEVGNELKRLENEEIDLRASRKDAEDEWKTEKERRHRVFGITPSSPQILQSPSSSFHFSPISTAVSRSPSIALSDCRSVDAVSPDSASSPRRREPATPVESLPVRLKVEPAPVATSDDNSRRLSSMFSKDLPGKVKTEKIPHFTKTEKIPHFTVQKELADAFELLVRYVLELTPVNDEVFVSQRQVLLSLIETDDMSVLPHLYSDLQKRETSGISHIPYSDFEQVYKRRIALSVSSTTSVEEQPCESPASTVVNSPLHSNDQRETSSLAFCSTPQFSSGEATGQPTIELDVGMLSVSWTLPPVSVQSTTATHGEHVRQALSPTSQGTQPNLFIPSTSPLAALQQLAYREEHQQSSRQQMNYGNQHPVAGNCLHGYGNQQYVNQQNPYGSPSYTMQMSAAQQQTAIPNHVGGSRSSYQHCAQYAHQPVYVPAYNGSGPSVAAFPQSNTGGEYQNPVVEQPYASPVMKCTVCAMPSSQTCSRCKTYSYCSRECQVSDWPAHRMICGQQVMKKSPNGAR